MKYVLIIGAKSELGMELASLYAKNNYNLYLAGRSIEKIRPQSEILEKQNNNKVTLCELDVADINSHKDFYNSLKIKPIGIVYVAGYYPDQNEALLNWKETSNTIDINYVGALSLLNLAVVEFQESQKGFIVGITSVAGLRGRGKNYIYGSTKAAFITYLNGLRNSLTKFNVNVLTVIPGFIKTKKSIQSNLPDILFITPKDLAIHIFDSQQANRGIIYSAFIWRVIMLIIKLIPDFIFKRMSI
jgi:hypothetical protein